MPSKNDIRKELRELRDMLSDEVREQLSTEIRIRLFQTNEYNNCSMLFTYVSFRSEVDTHEIIQQAFADGKEVFIPKVEAHGMEFYEITGLTELTPSKFGVPEPIGCESLRYIVDQKQRVTQQDLNETQHNRSSGLMLLPGLAFDPGGNRIGYGAGYYDRYLARYHKKEFYKIALAYDFQVLEQVPADQNDIKADAVITPSRCITV